MSAGCSLQSVLARDRDGAGGAPRGLLFGLSAEIGAGVTCYLGAPEDGTIALAEVLVGARAPERGVVLVAGASPALSAALRARVGYVGLRPDLPDAGSVAESISLAVSAWASPPAASDVLARVGLSELGARPLASASRAELRAVEWALLAALPDPALCVVFEPFCDLVAPTAIEVEATLHRMGERAPVVVLTSSPADARRFRTVHVLHRGFVAKSSSAPHAGLGSGQVAALSLWVERGARRLIAELASEVAVTSFDAGASVADAQPAALRVAGPDRDALALSVADAVVRSGAALGALAEASAGLSDVRAQTEFEQLTQRLSAERARALEAQAARERGALGPTWPGQPIPGGAPMFGAVMMGQPSPAPAAAPEGIGAPQGVAPDAASEVAPSASVEAGAVASSKDKEPTS